MDSYYCSECKKYMTRKNLNRHLKTQLHIDNVKKADLIQFDSEPNTDPTPVIKPITKPIIKGGDLQTISKKLPDFPWSKYKGEHHLPGHQYAGPGTRLDIRLDENNNPNPGEEPINRVDQAALKHDIAYNNEDIRSRQKADIDLIQDLNEIKKPTVGERIGRTLVKNAMKLKIMFGGNLNKDELLAQELHKEYRKPKTFLKVKVFNKDDIWGADLVEMKKEAASGAAPKGGEDYKYILTIIDLYTKYAWAFPLKNKT